MESAIDEHVNFCGAFGFCVKQGRLRRHGKRKSGQKCVRRGKEFKRWSAYNYYRLVETTELALRFVWFYGILCNVVILSVGSWGSFDQRTKRKQICGTM